MALLRRKSWGRTLIPVAAQPEYPHFDRRVRQPGLAYLHTNPNPTSREFNRRNYWNRARDELHAAYSGICAYTSMYLPDRGTVDHFHPKAICPNLAYEWSNFRLAGSRVNNSKGNSTEVLDPFQVGHDWFQLDVPSCLIVANRHLTVEIKQKVTRTIDLLRLNADDSYVQERCNILAAFAKRQIQFEFLEERYPFLAREVMRMNVVDQLLEKFKL